MLEYNMILASPLPRTFEILGELVINIVSEIKTREITRTVLEYSSIDRGVNYTNDGIMVLISHQ